MLWLILNAYILVFWVHCRRLNGFKVYLSGLEYALLKRSKNSLNWLVSVRITIIVRDLYERAFVFILTYVKVAQKY